MATTKGKATRKPRKTNANAKIAVKKRRMRPGNAAAKHVLASAKQNAARTPANSKPGAELEPPAVIEINRNVAPTDQDRPDDFYLNGTWSLQCLPVEGESNWDTVDTARDAEAVFGLWQEMRTKGWSNAKLRLQTEGSQDVHDVIGMAADLRQAVVVDPDGRIVPDVYHTFQLARLTKKWTVELQTGSTKVCVHEGTFKQCDEIYTRESKKKSAGTLVFLNPFGDVYKQQARLQFRQVLDVDKLDVNPDAPKVYNDIVKKKPGLIAKVRDRAAALLRRIAKRVAP